MSKTNVKSNTKVKDNTNSKSDEYKVICDDNYEYCPNHPYVTSRPNIIHDKCKCGNIIECDGRYQTAQETKNEWKLYHDTVFDSPCCDKCFMEFYHKIA